MSNSDNMTKTTVRVNQESLRKAKQELPHGGLSELVREQLNQIANNEDRAKRIKLRKDLEKLRDEREDAKKERAKWDREVSDLNRKIERVEEKLESLGDPESEYKGRLEAILSNMQETGMHVFPTHGSIQEASKKSGRTPEQVIEDLKKESNLPEARFRQHGGSL